jgi:hypothetical protein
MARVTTRREGEKSYRSDVHCIFKYNPHGPDDNQERRREKAIEVTCTGFLSINSMAWVTTRREGEKSYRSEVHRIFNIVDAGMCNCTVYSLQPGQIGVQTHFHVEKRICAAATAVHITEMNKFEEKNPFIL